MRTTSNNDRASNGQNKRQPYGAVPAFEDADLLEAEGNGFASNCERLKTFPPDTRRTWKAKLTTYVAIAMALMSIVLCMGIILNVVLGGTWGMETIDNEKSQATQARPSSTNTKTLHLYDELGRYILEDYDAQPPFSDFLPALAGYFGKPLYAFYINRGQGIAAFGVESKEYPIMEFHSANVAYQNTALLGFRTFIQGSRQKKDQDSFFVEPFSLLQTRFPNIPLHHNDMDKLLPSSTTPKRYMYVGSNEMQIREVDTAHRLETNVTYFVLPEEDFGSFVKRTTITNTDAKESLTLSFLDGLAQIQPAGGEMEKPLKTIGRTLQGWMGVYSPYDDSDGMMRMPFFRLSTQPNDSASVVVQKAGHWCLSVLESDNDSTLLPIVYDTSKIFGQDTSLLHPVGLSNRPISEILKEKQYGRAKTSSAFAAVDHIKLAPGKSVTISTFFGKANNVLDIPVISRRVLQLGFSQYKVMRTREIIKQITAVVETTTSHPLWDGHVQQMFLDNALRGGVPSILGEIDDDARLRNVDEDPRLKTYHLFSRIHGDLERDYNGFVIKPTFFSEGPGNFRDIAQNRRSDVLFYPRVGSTNLKTFLSMIQADGYNPLSIEASTFTISDVKACLQIATAAVGPADGHRAQREALTDILHSGPFRPGQLFLLMEEQHIDIIIAQQEFIDIVAAAADQHPIAVYKSGFWADHWTYYMDQIQAYLAIYPDWEERILFDERLPYFFSPAFVKPRHEKYVLSVSFDGTGKHVRQLDATEDNDEEKRTYMAEYIENKTGWYDLQANWQHTALEGGIFHSSPMAKLLLLATLKFASRDAYGMGVEYEGGRPGWDDASNGLVGMLGSGMPETYELVVLLRYIRSALHRFDRDLSVPVELVDLINSINKALKTLSSERGDERNKTESLGSEVPSSFFKYWDEVATARELYRDQTKILFQGLTEVLSSKTICLMIDTWLGEIGRGIERAMYFGSRGFNDSGTSGITPTYFSYNVTKWEKTKAINTNGHPFVRAKQFTLNLFPLFLEGPVRMMKTLDSDEAKLVYDRVSSSQLRDNDLKMYLISASLKGQSLDTGREMAFAPGWLENNSVWLHMSYKFYLEMLRHEMFEAFFEEITSGGMLPFMDPQVYGRSLMECSSFIASSSFEDPAIRGRGFLARLSGSTAEFLSMWILIMIGPHPFYIDKTTNLVQMQLVPALPRWLFAEQADDQKPVIRFKLFGSIEVTYVHDRGEEDLYRTLPSRYVVGLRDGSTFKVEGPSISNDLADKIRRVAFVASIDVYFEH